MLSTHHLSEFSNLSPPLTPSVHWAQQHKQMRETIIVRRIRDFEILLLKHGLVEVQIASHPPFLVRPGQVFILPAKFKHRVEVKSEPYALFLGIHFDFYGELKITRDEDILVFHDHPDDDYFCVTPDIPDIKELLAMKPIEASAELYHLMERIINEFTQRSTGYDLICQGLLLELLGELMRTLKYRRRVKKSSLQKAIEELARRIEQNPGDNWTNEKIAAMLHIHTDYMGRLFKKFVGTSPNKYVQYIRHKEAKRLLKETDDTIETIGRTVGYTNVHYFARIFHKWEGMPPGKYRKFCRLL